MKQNKRSSARHHLSAPANPSSRRLAKRAATQESPASMTRCGYPFADGRRCRLPLSDGHPALCVHHARQERQIAEPDRAGALLASLSGEFKTATDVNHVLGKLFSLVAESRIPRRDAAVLTYIAQLLLQSVSTVKHEIRITRGFHAEEQAIRSALAHHFPQTLIPQVS